MTEPNPLVSIIIPCYNVENFVASALDSILNQTYTNLEVICIDDCSNDLTYYKLLAIANSDSRVILRKNQSNLGLPLTLNLAISVSSGSYIIRMDPDDISAPRRVELMLSTFQSRNVDILSSGYCYLMGNSLKPHLFFRLPSSDAALKYVSLFRSPAAHATIIFKKSIKASFCYKTEYSGAEDYRLWIDLICSQNGIKFGCLDRDLYIYRIQDKSQSFKYRSTIHQKVLTCMADSRNILIPYKFISKPYWYIFASQDFHLLPQSSVKRSFIRAVNDIKRTTLGYRSNFFSMSNPDSCEIKLYAFQLYIYSCLRYILSSGSLVNKLANLLDVVFLCFKVKFFRHLTNRCFLRFLVALMRAFCFHLGFRLFAANPPYSRLRYEKVS